MGGKAKPTKHTAAEIAAKTKAATQSVGGGKAGVAERDAKANIKGAECQEPGCAGVKLASLTVCKTHWSNKHCTCRRAECECFPAEKYELMFARPTEKVHTHHNQLATNSSNKNASKAVRGSGRWRKNKLKEKQAAAAAAICDEAKKAKQTKQFTGKASGPSTL